MLHRPEAEKCHNPQSGFRDGCLSDIDRKIYNEQIRLIYNQGTFLVAGATLCAVVLTLFLWSESPQISLFYWLAMIGVTTALRLCCLYAYLISNQRTREKPYWGKLYWVGTLLFGAVWGVWPLLFYPIYSVEHLFLVSTLFAGMVAVNAAATSVYLPAFFAFAVPVLLPLTVSHLSSERDSLAVVGLLLIMFLIMNVILILRANRQNRKFLTSQLANEQLLQSLAAEKQIAERAMVAKSRFLAAASHDLRQPMHAMGLFLGALRKREDDPQKMRIIEDMSKSADALNGLFNSLLDVSRLDAEIIEFNPAHVPANRMFDALRAQFEQQASEKGIELRIDVSEHVLYCDGILLERVLRNLFANAVQYTVTGHIALKCEDRDERSKWVTLEDTGLGIPDEFADDVFSEYYQVNNPGRDRKKGLGLGLSIVRRLCELMDIPLEMDSDEGEGTVFRLVVPAGSAEKVVPLEQPVIDIVAPGRCVLVIDDEFQVLQSMRHMLEGSDCEVLLAESARGALKELALSDRVPDIIISDYRLADDLSGVDAVAAVRESVDRYIPAILVTGDTSPERLKEVSDTGLHLLHKPVRPDELNQMMQTLCKQVDNPSHGSTPEHRRAANQ